VKILLIDDHAIVRDGVSRLLSTQLQCQILEADSAESGMPLVQSEKPDLVVLDLNLGGIGGLGFLKQLKSSPVRPPVIVLSMHAEPVYVSQSLKAGARGYVSKAAAPDEVVSAVRSVLAGGRYVEKALEARLSREGGIDGDPLGKLTAREIEILRLLGRGESLNGIADILGVAYKTVANSCTQMKIKLGLERTADLIRVAIGTEGITRQ
jgi:two-component system, NarL family, invasion response regulator UvrY